MSLKRELSTTLGQATMPCQVRGKLGTRPRGAMTSPRVSAAGIVLLLLLSLAVVITSARTKSATSSITSTSTHSPLSPRDAAYYDAVLPALIGVAEEANFLAELGQRHSRNLFEIRAGQQRMNDRLTAADDLVADGDTPTQFGPAMQSYRVGAATVRDAMRQAQAGFLRFDWNQVATASLMMSDGATRLQGATTLFQLAAHVALIATPRS